MIDDSEVQCPCCKLFYKRHDPPAFAPRRSIPLDWHSGLCWDCCNHQGDSDTVKSARGKHHGQMLRREYQAAREQITRLRQELEDRPVVVKVRVENLDADTVAAAVVDRDDAYHRRDVAMGALSDLRLSHRKRDDDKSRCLCGRPYAKCDAARVADGFDGLALWEMTQAERAWLGDYSYLRRDHPARLGRGWFADTYPDAG